VLGAGKLQPLMSEVEQLEAEPRFEGLAAAVQVRLARRQLPSVNDNGLVEYAVFVAARGTPPGVDTDWIKSGAYGLASPAKSDSAETTKARNVSPRSVGMSAKSLSKLPWEKEASEVCSTHTRCFIKTQFLFVS